MTFLMELFSEETPVFANINQRLLNFRGNLHTTKSLFRMLDHEKLYLNLIKLHNILETLKVKLDILTDRDIGLFSFKKAII